MSAHGIEQVIFRVASALLVPVLILVLLALAVVLVETGKVVVEMYRRRGRSLPKLDAAIACAREPLEAGDRAAALVALSAIARSAAMARALGQLVDSAGAGDDRVGKILADFDYRSLRRLERSRILVRAGPALGLMGTLIPLAPALAALARGDVAELSNDLRIAFSVTILGLFVGAVAFGISLIRDRLYSQDLSDLEYVAANLDGASTVEPQEAVDWVAEVPVPVREEQR